MTCSPEEETIALIDARLRGAEGEAIERLGAGFTTKALLTPGAEGHDSASRWTFAATIDPTEWEKG